MIEFTLTQPGDVRNRIKYSVSPLFEMATSLYVLAQKKPNPAFEEWTSYTLKIFTSERLLAEWNYFLPIFTQRIPRFFDPFRTQKVMSVDEQYEYFVDLHPHDFQESLKFCLQQDPDDSQTVTPIAADLHSDPDLVRSRFILFISSYWQLLFEAKWEELAPKFVREAEEIEYAFQSIDTTVSFLQSITPHFSYQQSNGLLSIDIPEELLPCSDAHLLILFPSFFFTGSPSFSVHEQNILLSYNSNVRAIQAS